MKRSKMLKVIKKVLDTWQDCRHEPKMYEQVLKAVEKAGMLPPEIPEPGQPMHPENSFINEWEPEK